MPPIDRHALLADPSRRHLLDALRDAAGPSDLRTLAQRVGLHPNSAREQLRRLEDAGMVRSTTASPSGRGRPGRRYELDPDGEADPYRRLAGVLADELLGLPDREALTLGAGERWGRSAAASLVPSGAAPLDALVELMDRAGFAPEPPVADAAPGAEIRLRACPFLPLERQQLPVVCGVHLGFIRGALRELGSGLDAVAIEPFVRPDLCVATLAGPIDG